MEPQYVFFRPRIILIFPAKNLLWLVMSISCSRFELSSGINSNYHGFWDNFGIFFSSLMLVLSFLCLLFCCWLSLNLEHGRGKSRWSSHCAAHQSQVWSFFSNKVPFLIHGSAFSYKDVFVCLNRRYSSFFKTLEITRNLKKYALCICLAAFLWLWDALLGQIFWLILQSRETLDCMRCQLFNSTFFSRWFWFLIDSVLKKYPSKFVGCCLANPAEDGSGIKQLENLVLEVFPIAVSQSISKYHICITVLWVLICYCRVIIVLFGLIPICGRRVRRYQSDHSNDLGSSFYRTVLVVN